MAFWALQFVTCARVHYARHTVCASDDGNGARAQILVHGLHANMVVAGAGGVGCDGGYGAVVVMAGYIASDEYAAGERVQHGVDPTTGCEEGACDAEEEIGHPYAGHCDHAAYGDGQGEDHVHGRVHDHEFCGARQLVRAVVVHDASEAAAEVDEDVAVDGDGAELNDEDPQIVQP